MTRRVDTIAGWVSVRRTRVIYPRVDACHHVSLLRSRCRERPARDGFVDPFRRHAPPPRFRRRRRVDAEPPSRLRLAPRLFLQRRQAPRALRVPQPRSARVQRAGSRTVGNAVQATRAAHRARSEAASPDCRLTTDPRLPALLSACAGEPSCAEERGAARPLGGSRALLRPARPRARRPACEMQMASAPIHKSQSPIRRQAGTRSGSQPWVPTYADPAAEAP